MKTSFLLLSILGVLGFYACSSSTSSGIDEACIIKGKSAVGTKNILCVNGKGVAFTADSCKTLAISFYNSVEGLNILGLMKAPDTISSSIATSCPDNAIRSCHMNLTYKLDTVAMYDTTYQYICGITTVK